MELLGAREAGLQRMAPARASSSYRSHRYDVGRWRNEAASGKQGSAEQTQCGWAAAVVGRVVYTLWLLVHAGLAAVSS